MVYPRHLAHIAHCIALSAACSAALSACDPPVVPMDANATADSSTDVVVMDVSAADEGAVDASVTDVVEEPVLRDEREPNNGTTTTEFDTLTVRERINGAIGTPDDADIFRIGATAGRVYTVSLRVPEASALHADLTVFDDGRDGDRAGDDYIKIVRAAAPGATEIRLQFLAMGTGGYLIAVRDARNLGSSPAHVGGETFRYEVSATETPAAQFARPVLTLPADTPGTLESPGALALYPFTVQSGEAIDVDLRHTGDLDARLMVFASSTNGWVARNDDRSTGDSQPLLTSAPLPTGMLYLIVENIDPMATSFGYRFTAATRR